MHNYTFATKYFFFSQDASDKIGYDFAAAAWSVDEVIRSRLLVAVDELRSSTIA